MRLKQRLFYRFKRVEGKKLDYLQPLTRTKKYT